MSTAENTKNQYAINSSHWIRAYCMIARMLSSSILFVWLIACLFFFALSEPAPFTGKQESLEQKCCRAVCGQAVG